MAPGRGGGRFAPPGPVRYPNGADVMCWCSRAGHVVAGVFTTSATRFRPGARLRADKKAGLHASSARHLVNFGQFQRLPVARRGGGRRAGLPVVGGGCSTCPHTAIFTAFHRRDRRTHPALRAHRGETARPRRRPHRGRIRGRAGVIDHRHLSEGRHWPRWGWTATGVRIAGHRQGVRIDCARHWRGDSGSTFFTECTLAQPDLQRGPRGNATLTVQLGITGTATPHLRHAVMAGHRGLWHRQLTDSVAFQLRAARGDCWTSRTQVPVREAEGRPKIRGSGLSRVAATMRRPPRGPRHSPDSPLVQTAWGEDRTGADLIGRGQRLGRQWPTAPPVNSSGGAILVARTAFRCAGYTGSRRGLHEAAEIRSSLVNLGFAGGMATCGPATDLRLYSRSTRITGVSMGRRPPPLPAGCFLVAAVALIRQATGGAPPRSPLAQRPKPMSTGLGLWISGRPRSEPARAGSALTSRARRGVGISTWNSFASSP